MASEDFVSYSIMTALRDADWDIFHYHPPGGQAAWGIYVVGKLIYLDILAYKNSNVLLAENKGKFSNQDINKLRMILLDKSAQNQLQSFVRAQCTRLGLPCVKQLRFSLAHGYSGKLRASLEDINLIHVSEEGDLTVTVSRLNPLII